MEAETRLARETPQVTLSQPAMANSHTSIMQALNALKMPKRDSICFSQPTHNEDLMIQLTQSPVTKENFHNLVKRMTRFYVNTVVEKTLESLCAVLDTLHYTWTADPNGGVSIIQNIFRFASHDMYLSINLVFPAIANFFFSGIG